MCESRWNVIDYQHTGCGLYDLSGKKENKIKMADTKRPTLGIQEQKHFKKMSGYVGFLPPPTYFLHIRCDQWLCSKPSSVCRKYVGGGKNHTHFYLA